ncbi:hypothetical protein FF011L_26820 [Roseimaritima multifibrata]|uniref:Uncharacterized protein n=1 Tax=Roseimaritima multifibrata TaxID=1930274 RepID=A0A517MG94_9BACT|nr:hypothetical protein FF011L_26820 [Roseimaritima multifibrata]
MVSLEQEILSYSISALKVRRQREPTHRGTENDNNQRPMLSETFHSGTRRCNPGRTIRICEPCVCAMAYSSINAMHRVDAETKI